MNAKCEDHCRNQVRGPILTCHYFPSHIFFLFQPPLVQNKEKYYLH